LTTALFARILLNQVLPIKRWLALLLLTLGVILTQVTVINAIVLKGYHALRVTQVNFNGQMGDLSWRVQREDATYLFGLLAIGFASVSSGFAGVYNEKIIKNGQQPLLLIRSFQLSKIQLNSTF
jgi:UDP-sugar transporter A1/2/3